MDKIFIDRLALYGRHGVKEEENALGQMFYISAEIGICLRGAGKTDCLDKTLDYGRCCRKIKRICESNTFKLIETLAEHIAEELLQMSPAVKCAKVRVDKPSAPVGLPLDSVGIEIERKRHTAFIALGSNMGDKRAYIEKAVEEINADKSCNVVRVSKLIETAPVSDIPQDDYLNGVMEIETLYDPEELLAFLNETEARADRVRKEKWGPRTLDLDIIFYDNEVIQTEKLTVPHPLMHKRGFVLEPLCMIAPHKIHPVLNKTAAQLLEELQD